MNVYTLAELAKKGYALEIADQNEAGEYRVTLTSRAEAYPIAVSIERTLDTALITCLVHALPNRPFPDQEGN